MSKVTLSQIDQKLDDLKEFFKAHAESDDKHFEKLWNRIDGTESTPGITTRIDRLEQKEASRTKHLAALWGAIPAIHGIMRWLLK